MEGSIEFLEPKKFAREKYIHTNILKQNSDFLVIHVQKDINASISALNFPNDLKEADLISVYKKKSKLSKENYRLISILLNICMKGACMMKHRNILKLGFPNFSALFPRVIVHNTIY